MPIADWNLSQGVIRDFDREKANEYAPYTGPKPSNGVYKFRIVKHQMKQFAGDEESHPRLWALLTLIPRTKEEKRYAGYKVNFSAQVSDDNPQWYVPLLDVLGVSDQEFRRKTRITEEGNIKSIGNWRNDGSQELLAEIRHNEQYTNVRWVGPVTDATESDEDEEESEEDEDEDF